MITKSLLAATLIAASGPAAASTVPGPVAAKSAAVSHGSLAALPPNCRYITVKVPQYVYIRIHKENRVVKTFVGFKRVQKRICTGPTPSRFRRG